MLPQSEIFVPLSFQVYFESLPYGLNEDTELIDYDEMEALAVRFKPKLIIAGYSAYSR